MRVLYAMIVDPRRRIDEMADILVADDFYHGRNVVLFKALLEMHAQVAKIGADTIVSFLKSRRQWENAGGAEHIAIVMSVQYVDLCSRHADNAEKVVRDCSLRRAMIHAGEGILRSAWDQGTPIEESLEQAESEFGTMQVGASLEHLVDGPTAAMMFTDHIDAVMERGEHLGIATGLWKFDITFGGLLPGEYCVLAADSSAGKTSLRRRSPTAMPARGVWCMSPAWKWSRRN